MLGAGWLLLGLDWESFYLSGAKAARTGQQPYSLRDLDVPSYVCGPRFEETLFAVKENANPAFVVDGPDIPRYLAGLADFQAQGGKVLLYGHNLMFDAAIASWRHNWRATLNVCTLALARRLLAYKLRSLSLASVAKYLGLGDKGNAIVNVDGMRRQDIINAGFWPNYCDYAKQDIELAFGIFQWGFPQVSLDEHVVADSVLRLVIEPVFELDQDLLRDHLADVVQQKQEALAIAMMASGMQGKEDLMSNDRFAEVLKSLGVDPPTKLSLVTKKTTWAFAKSDEGMKELAEHDDPRVQAVVSARLGHKSTLEETRTQRYLNIAGLNFPAFGTGLLPIPLKVSGAHTHRLSGDWKLNAQNMGRKSKLRKALKAPAGHVVITCDERQIEARMSATFAEQWDLVEQFARGEDTYCAMATKIFGVPVTKADKPRRFMGKQCVLSGMYGVGYEKFYWNNKAKARDEGVEFTLTLADCESVIRTYRAETPAITEMRNRLNRCIPLMTNPDCNFTIGPVRFLYQKILLPDGNYLHYDNLRYDEVSGNWLFTFGGFWKRLYGGKLLENIIQALAAVVVRQAWLRMRPRIRTIGGRFGLQCHDELVAVIPVQFVEQGKALFREEMGRQIEWMPRCPVDVEIGVGPTYGDAK